MIKYSRQREAIINFLDGRTDHPTAETIYLNIKQEFPNISIGTVYRNLSLLEEIGQIKRISSDSGTDHYDFNVSPHFHFHCTSCGCVSDIMIDMDDDLINQAKKLTNATIEKCSVIFSGICPDCKKKLS